MRNIILYVAMLLIVMACNDQEITIKINKNVDRYELVAVYPKSKDLKVAKVLMAAFKNQDSLLLTKSISSGKEITLANGTVFYLRYNPGKLEMEMLLEKNNRNGLKYFDETVTDVKSALR